MADSTINSSSSSAYNASASMSVANLTASAMMGSIMAGGDLGFVKDVQEKIHDVTQETRNAQSNLRSAQQKSDALQAQVAASNSKKATENSERKDKPSSKSSGAGGASDAAGLQAQLAAAQQAVSDARQIVKNLQSQLNDLITRALPQAQQKEDTARQQDHQRADAQRSQGQSAQAEENLGKELTRTLSDGLEAGKAQATAKGSKAEQLPQSNVVDRTGEFEDVGEGEKNYNDAYLEGSAEQSPAEYAKAKKKDAAAKTDDGMEGASQSGGKPAPRSGAAPAGSGLPDAEGLSHADVAKLLRTPTDGKPQQLSKAAASGPTVASSSKAGMQVSSGNQATSVAPRPTGGGSTSGPQSGSSVAHASANSARGNKVASPADSGLSLAEAPGFGAKPAIGGRGNQADSQMNGRQDRAGGADAHATTTVSLGGVSVALPKGVARAASSPAVAAAGQALVRTTRDDAEPMKGFLRSSQPDGRSAEQLAGDTLGGFRQMTQALGLGGGSAPQGGGRGTSAVGGGANGGAQDRLGGVVGLSGGDGSSYAAANVQGSAAGQDAGKMDAATTATLAASISGTQQGGQDAAPAPGAGRSSRAAGAPPSATKSGSPQAPGSAAGGAAQVGRAASGPMGVNIGNGGKMRASLSESGAARAVVLGKVTRRAQDEIDPFDVSDVDTGGMDPDDFAQLSPLQRVMALMVSAAGEAEGQAKGAAAALTDNAELTQQLGNKKTELAVAIRAAGGLPDEGEPVADDAETLGDRSPAPSELLATPVGRDVDGNQSAHRRVTRALDSAVTQGSSLLEHLQTATQLVTTFAQGANNVALGANAGRGVQGKVGA